MRVVACDRFFSTEMMHAFGFFHAKNLADCHHVFKDDLTDHFGETGCAHVKSSLVQMIKAKSEEFFDQALVNAKTMLVNFAQGREFQLESKLNELASTR